ncbi:NrsF family protein [Paraburkholderia silvatlantica]|uniref:NrsF family protein n=1 Tax=Paraburkholderia silvatlantica TaxID=321895 RepID=UPI0037524B90
MKTEDLISVLVEAPRPPSRAVAGKRLGLALVASLITALLILQTIRGNPVRQGVSVLTPLFWVKVLLPLSMTTAGLWVTARLSRPGVGVGRAWLALGLPVVAVWLAAMAILLVSPAPARPELVLGHTWRTCSLYIVELSSLPLLLLLWAMRGLAATRPVATGVASGLLAGAIGTLAYCFRCPETAVPFWATWYSLGMAVPAVIGGLLGRWALRW